MCSIDRLPVEVLILVFQVVINVALQRWENIRSRFINPNSELSAVCSRWRNIIESSPQLWNRLLPGLSVRGLEYTLERSSNYPIDVSYASPCWRLQRRDLISFFGTLGEAIGRCRNIDIALGAEEWFSIDAVDIFLKLPATNLQHLKLASNSNWAAPVSHIRLFGGECPQLRSFHIVGVKCDWTMGMLQELEDSHVIGLAFDDLNQLLDVIRRTPKLRTLEMTSCVVYSDFFDKFDSAVLIQLESLDVGLIADLWPYMTTELLDLIHAPRNCARFVTIYAPDVDCEYVLERPLGEPLFGGGVDGNITRVVLSITGTKHPINVNEWKLTAEVSTGNTVKVGGVRETSQTDVPQGLDYVAAKLQDPRFTEQVRFTLAFSGAGARQLGQTSFLKAVEALPPIHTFELSDPDLPPGETIDVHFLSALLIHCNPAFQAVRCLILRGMPASTVAALVKTMLDSMEKCSKGGIGDEDLLLDLDIHISMDEFIELEKSGEADCWRNNARVANVTMSSTI